MNPLKFVDKSALKLTFFFFLATTWLSISQTVWTKAHPMFSVLKSSLQWCTKWKRPFFVFVSLFFLSSKAKWFTFRVWKSSHPMFSHTLAEYMMLVDWCWLALLLSAERQYPSVWLRKIVQQTLFQSTGNNCHQTDCFSLQQITVFKQTVSVYRK